MEKLENKDKGIEEAGNVLFTFATDREDIKMIMSVIPEEADIKRETVEYELQILKIISAGWSINYYLEDSPHKDQLAERYWDAVHEYSQSISEATGLMIGQQIDYFQIVKDRLDMYLKAMMKNSDAPEPAVVIGPEFARACGNVADIFTVMSGSRMFILTIGSVKEYFEKIKLL